jgi:hypothetical protein
MRYYLKITSILGFGAKLLTFVAITTLGFTLLSMSDSIKPEKDYSKEIFDKHESYRESAITHRRFKHKDILPLIQNLPFEKEIVGKSFEEREIYKIKLGTGKIPVLLWSQMHGDEATATMALLDIFRFFQAKDDGFDDFRAEILNKCTLHFVPMLNPDGAERFQRRTATGIDMNRDALRTQTPEGALLKKLQNTLQPTFAFNLHDQGTRYSAGISEKQATISFLATAYDFDRNWNDVRTRSMQVICKMNDALQQFIPGHVAKYSDEHEPRAFGDNIQKWGSSLILIESGGYKDDREKQFIRKLNFTAILTALYSVAKNDYRKYKLKHYEAIPNNDNVIFDLLIRNVEFIENGKTTTKDIGINLNERNTYNATRFVLESSIADMGDLSIFYGIKEIDGKGLKVALPSAYQNDLTKFNLNNKQLQRESVNIGDEATFLLIKDNKIEHIIINGQKAE